MSVSLWPLRTMAIMLLKSLIISSQTLGVCVYMCCVYMGTCVWKREADVKCLLLMLCLIFETGSHRPWSSLGSASKPQGPAQFYLTKAGITGSWVHVCPAFHVGLLTLTKPFPHSQVMFCRTKFVIASALYLHVAQHIST